LLSFVLAVAVIKASQREDVLSRFALNEANRSEAFLKTENKKTVTHIVKQLLDISIRDVDYVVGNTHYDYLMDVKEYVELSSTFKSDYWKIVNKVVDNGYVYLKTNEVVRLIRDKIKAEIYRRIKESSVPSIPERLQYLVEIVKNRPLPREPFESSQLTSYPPCVAHAIARSEANENLSHFERFFLTAFLLKAGKSVEDVIKFFSTSPDFNEKVARYQVEHIAGLKGGRKAYNVPDCKTLFSQSLCYKNESCNNISHPLQYGKRYIKKGEKNFDRKGRLLKEDF